MKGGRSRVRRGEQEQSRGRRKRFAPQVRHALQAGRCRIWGLVIVECSTGERGEPLLCRGLHCREHGDQEKAGKRAGDRPGAATGEESLGMMVLPSMRRRVRCAFEIHASPSAGVRLPAERGRGNASEQCRIRLLSMFRTGAECREKGRARRRNAGLGASLVVFSPKIG